MEKLTLNIKSPLLTQIHFHLSSEQQNSMALKKEGRKIYIIKNGSEFLYVGEANCCMKTRFTRGLTSVRHFIKHGAGRGGYKGYKWLHACLGKSETRFDVYVHIFKGDEPKDFVQATEGELVWLIRKEGSWPLYQNEIHFRNIPGAAQLAKQIFGLAHDN